MALSWHEGGPGVLAGVDWVWRRLRPGSCLSLVLSSELASHLFPPGLLLRFLLRLGRLGRLLGPELGDEGLGEPGLLGVDGW